jgi:ring-1,2-phenylacetyl-CoA epoxidase subunit PaaC
VSAVATPGTGAGPGGAGGAGLDDATRAALAELLEFMADDELVLGYWDSQWTGIAPVLEEDVAFSSLAQDEIGHAQALYELLAELTGDQADRIAYGREVDGYRHAALLDHARGDWAFSIARRFLYDTADAVRLDALAGSSYAPLAGLVAKMRREERYHLAHMHAWMVRLARGGEEPSRRLAAACERLWPDALTVFTPPAGEDRLLAAGILPEPVDAWRQRWLEGLAPLFEDLRLAFPFRRAESGRLEPRFPEGATGGRAGHAGSGDFRWLWGELTSVYRSEPGATW